MARLVPLTDLNVGKARPDRVKLSTILLVRYVRPFGHPVHVDPFVHGTDGSLRQPAAQPSA